MEYKREGNDNDDENILTNHNITHASVSLSTDIVRERFAKAGYKVTGVCVCQSDNDMLTLRIAQDQAGLFCGIDMQANNSNGNGNNGSLKSEQNMTHKLGNHKLPNRSNILAETMQWVRSWSQGRRGLLLIAALSHEYVRVRKGMSRNVPTKCESTRERESQVSVCKGLCEICFFSFLVEMVVASKVYSTLQTRPFSCPRVSNRLVMETMVGVVLYHFRLYSFILRVRHLD